MAKSIANVLLQDFLSRAMDGALGFLARLVSESDFSTNVRSAFGDDVDRKVIADVLSDILLERSTPKVKLIDAETLGGARGAYDANSDTIYISKEFVASHATSLADVERVLLEEIGHAIDAKLDHGDARGDEGAIFASLILGESLPGAELQALRSEDDHGTITIDGQAVDVEFAATYGTVTLDGSAADWTAADRIDTPGTGTAGFELYGKYTGNAFVFALKTTTATIGAETTFWLNTDQNKATGYQIWGFAGGAEYNVNFDAAGLPKLYTGDAGQTLVNAAVDHAYAADKQFVEFAVPVSLLAGAPSATDVLVDVNNATFLPGDYSSAAYTVAAPAAPTPPTVVGDITLNGDLADWTAANRLEVPGSGVAGYEVYGKYVGDSYVFALKADAGQIGAGTTLWLSTDQNKATGYQIWGFAGGAEYNVNFTSTPGLYTGAEGATLVSAYLAHAFNAGHNIVEFAVAASQLAGAPKAVDVLADVNDQVYLPTDYSLYTYTVAAPQAPMPPPVVGAITLDGDLKDWTAADRIELAGNTVAGHEVYGKLVGDNYIIAIKSDIAIGANTTAWFNVDQNATTGYQIFGAGGGAEYNVNFGANKQAGLYTGAAGQTLVQQALPAGFSADGKIVEFAVSRAALGGATTKSVDLLLDVNDQVFLPGDYGNPYTIRDTANLPPVTDHTAKVAIVYSETSAAQFYDLTNYSQLFMSAQYQATMAGVPFDVLSEKDLTDIAKLAAYDTIIFPSFRNVPIDKVTAIENALKSASYDYGVSIIAAGDFMTNDATGAALPGDSYSRMKSILGVSQTGFGTGDIAVYANDTTHPVMDGYQAHELIRNYTNTGFAHYGSVFGQANVLVDQVVGGQTYNAVLATRTGAENVHFSSEAMLGDSNLLWQALQWTAKGTGPEIGLQMSRQPSIVASRTDMDQSQETLDVNPESGGPGIYDKMMPILAQWKEAYNFVGSYYINVGNNPPDQTTDWSVSKPYYQQLLAMGNEIGTHSYTHPENTNTLTAAQIAFEFNQSQLVIEQQLGIDVTGTAVPGAPENVATAQKIIQYFDYMSGGYSGVGAGFPGAFGYLTPDNADKPYLAPNVSFDFTLVEFQNMTPAQASAAWAKEWAQLTSHADVPVVLWPWHDYGAAQWSVDPPAASPYTTAMYTSFIANAFNAGAEFVTLADLAQRIESFEQTKITYTTSGNLVTASVVSNDVGKMALDIDGGQIIQKVNGWYAYDDDSVFLPKAGGQFAITLGASQDDVTHIVALPSRGELLSVTGDGTNLSFTVLGDGKVVIDLKNPAGQNVSVQGADIVSLVGDRLELELADPGTHDVSVTIGGNPPPPVDHAPVITSNGGGDAATLNVAENSLTVTTVKATDQDGGALTYALAATPDAQFFNINATTGALSFKAGPDFEAPADADTNNRYDVTVQATDSTGLSDSQTLAIAVTNVNGVTTNGTNGANTMNGTPENDTLNGLGGADTLNGLGGNDILVGGNGADIMLGGVGSDNVDGGAAADSLNGGLGADVMKGGAGRDLFVFQTKEDFGTLAARDLISDFKSAEDRIDLRGIDANSSVTGDQAFQFLSQAGAAFTGAGQVRFVQDAASGKTFVEGNMDANLAADFRLDLNGIVPLKPADFIL